MRRFSLIIMLACMITPILAQFTGWTDADRLEIAVRRGVGEAFFNDNIRERARIAVVQVTARDRDFREFVRSGLQDELTNSEFVVIDRRNIERVIDELELQFGWEYDQNTTVRVGRLVNAQFIAIARVEGEGSFRNLNITVTNVETGAIAGSSRIRF